MTHILITGAGGFLGAELTAALAGRGDEVTALDIVIGQRLAALAEAHGNVTPVTGEVTEWPALFDLIRARPPDAIVHCAAVVSVTASLDAPNRTFQVNVGGSLNIFEAMRLCGVKRVVHLSSEETYGHFQAAAATEDHPQQPLYPYGISKVAVEHLGRSYRELHGIECINVRTGWV